MLLGAVHDGVSLLTWEQDAFAFADSFDEAAGRYRGLRVGRQVAITDSDAGLVVRPVAARQQIDAEKAVDLPHVKEPPDDRKPPKKDVPLIMPPKRFHGSVTLDPTRVGRDASRIGDEVIAHLAGLVGARVKVTLEIEVEIPGGVPDNVVRTVTENSRTLKFVDQGFEAE